MNPEESTRLFYEAHAREYFESTYEVSLNATWDLLSSKLRPGASILDLGSGSGRDLRYFSTRGFNVVGLDYSLALLHLARSVSGCSVVLADIRALPFRECSFDAIWAVASLLHLRKETIPAVLTEVGRVLRGNGYMLISVKEGFGEEFDSLGRYTAFYQQEEWKSLLEASGFAIIHILRSTELRQRRQEEPKLVHWITCLAQVQL